MGVKARARHLPRLWRPKYISPLVLSEPSSLSHWLFLQWVCPLAQQQCQQARRQLCARYRGSPLAAGGWAGTRVHCSLPTSWWLGWISPSICPSVSLPINPPYFRPHTHLSRGCQYSSLVTRQFSMHIAPWSSAFSRAHKQGPRQFSRPRYKVQSA